MTPIESTVQHVDWSRQAGLYQVNLRQYTPEGTFAAFEAHLPRLRAMGVNLLWLMPVQPIGVKNRKGTLGSCYSVSDHGAVNPEFGSLDDFKHLVQAVHAAGLHVIIDWVANHTAWDHVWVTQHPEWYLKNADGEIHSYVYDNGHALESWSDVVGLDYTRPAVQDAMCEALRFWVAETGIDGYRCDVAGLVPMAFWERARAELDAIKPVFMLAEWSDPALHAAAFDMSYDWALHDVLSRIARGKGDANDLRRHLAAQVTAGFPADAYRMTFTSNHDKNAWEGHDAEVWGPAFKAMAVLAATLPGMPLIYGGQEAVLDKRLAFFEKDAIDWKSLELATFYTGLMGLKAVLQALRNGAQGGAVELLEFTHPALFAFRRGSDRDAITVVANLSDQPQRADLAVLEGDTELAPWAFRLLCSA
jgi:glycosidase